MKRFKLIDPSPLTLVEHVDGEWVRYSDHIGAMKRIAGEGREPGGWKQVLAELSGSDIARIYREATGQHLRSQDEYLAFAFTRAILAAALPESRQMVASGEKQKPVATIRVTNNGYSMTLSTYVAYALSEGKHDLYAAPPTFGT